MIPGEQHPLWKSIVWGGERWVFLTVKSGKSEDLCGVAFCRNLRRVECRRDSRTGKLYTTKHLCCPKCNMRLARARNPIKAAYDNIRKRAKERGQIFSISLRNFSRVVRKSGYVDRKGRRSGDLHIDRCIPALGYVMGNIRVITARANVAKGNRERHDIEEPF
jgi:hypothetical protein